MPNAAKRTPNTRSAALQQTNAPSDLAAAAPDAGPLPDPFAADYGSSSLDTSLPALSNLTAPNHDGSNQLIRRPTNQHLTTRSTLAADAQWLGPLQSPDQTWDGLPTEDDELAQRAAAAKREAQIKRKQIPPFVLKLWSFLNEDKNTDLIRWTDQGSAFTVLDEDEFARTLIPELFKHNNYASFVRQLNMYGFHKKVGLNANSMKAAEKKTKDPNVYWHEYFRKGREDLLWLIQKPQSKTASVKRKRGGDDKDDDSEEDRKADIDTATLAKLKQDKSDLVVLPKTEVVAMRQEVQRLQRQQSIISKMIGQLKDQNAQFYRQASEFQQLHERHENSINAILTFLATFYNRSLEAGIDLTSMFGANAPPQQHQGAVVDMDPNEYPSINTSQIQKFRKPQLLLQSSSPVRPDPSSLQPGRVATQPNSPRPSSRNAKRQSTEPVTKPTSTSPIIEDDVDVDSPGNFNHADSPDFMSLINAANANTPGSSSPHFDFSNALNHAQNAHGQGPLTPQQRNKMLDLIASQQQQQQQANNGAGKSSNNALTTPNMPQMPDLNQFARNQEQLEMLTRLQKEQDSKVADLAGRLTPLSPSGSIPGLADGYGNAGFDFSGQSPGDFDFDQFLQNPFDAQLGAAGGAADEQGAAGVDGGGGLDFDFEDGGAGVKAEDELFGDVQQDHDRDDQGGRVQSVHSDD